MKSHGFPGGRLQTTEGSGTDESNRSEISCPCQEGANGLRVPSGKENIAPQPQSPTETFTLGKENCGPLLIGSFPDALDHGF